MNKIKFLTAIFVALLSTAAFAQTTVSPRYFITGSNGLFKATKEFQTIADNQPIQAVIDAVQMHSKNSNVYIEIDFGNNNSALDIGTESVLFANHDDVSWNKPITLWGKITSSGGFTIKVQDDVSITSHADIFYTGDAIALEGCGICNIDGTVSIIGGTVTSTLGTISFGHSPTISEGLKLRLEDRISILKSQFSLFTPGEKIYSITLMLDPSFVPVDLSGHVVVVGGAEYAENFTLANEGWGLVASGDDLVIAATTPIINSAPTSSFGIVQNGQSLQIVGTSQATPIRIYNLRGNVLMDRTAMPNENISVAHLPKGVYMVKAGGKTIRVVR